MRLNAARGIPLNEALAGSAPGGLETGGLETGGRGAKTG